ncbi:hypothetical protein ACOCEA_04850 [Maribacter sp. CXY002]|uniref:hypothetical protein n=1 Tax=Maribacter luteocoastalis TaxID=3407671 RepID=UPI003B67F5A1
MANLKNYNSVVLLFCFSALLLTACISDDVGEDTDGLTQAGFPEVTTRTVATSDQGTSVEAGGTVVNTGGSAIIARGVCWSTQPNPSIENETTMEGTGEGPFVSSVTGLEPNTRYYLRAYATNKNGTNYGGEVDFFTAKIYRGNVVLSSQEEVDSFGAEEYLTIIGNVFIGKNGGSNITNLSALSNLNQIRGDFTIGTYDKGNPLLTNLNGLEYLALIDTYFLNDFIPKNLIISYNENLENVDALNGLGYFNGDLRIYSNDKLKNLNGLSRLTTAKRISISGNDALENINGLENITKVDFLLIGDNPMLTNLNGLRNLPDVIQDISIVRNESLSDISALSNVTRVKYNLIITECPEINSLDVFNKITIIGARLVLIDLGITNLDSFQLLESLGTEVSEPEVGYGAYLAMTLTLSDNRNLRDFCGLKELLGTDFAKLIDIQRNAYNPSREDIVADNCKNI